MGTTLRLVQPGEAFGIQLIPPSPPTADIQFYLNTVGGTFLVDQGTGNKGWLVGGNSVASTGLIGSTNAFDVHLVAGPLTTPRLLVSASSAAVSLPNQTEIRFYEPVGGGTNYTAFKGADTQADDITLFFPTTVGDVGASLGVQSNPTATSANLMWITP
jgi:hypothetical protein